jgi:hypothetical protein
MENKNKKMENKNKKNNNIETIYKLSANFINR